MNLYTLTIHFRAGELVGSTTYLARGRTIAEAKRFARAKFRTLNPDAKISRVTADDSEPSRPSIGLRYTR